MKNLIGLSIVALGAWWLFVGGTPLTEAGVREYYLAEAEATLHRAPDARCNLLDAKFKGHSAGKLAGRPVEMDVDRDTACKAWRDMFGTFEAVGTQMGGVLELRYEYEIESIAVDAAGKSAQVEMSYRFAIAGNWMLIKGSRSDRLMRRFGRTRLAESDEVSVVTGGL
ncbi:MAG: hypothetical protein KF778_07840 [Rhodocyclaceae bacterium]|nr:hypothetical protein [Rhodocyclaceae bacterium]MBX3668301.1 hypothetical protein [Rhodocyclaceae bacterium]